MAQEDRRIGTVIGGKWRVDSLLGSGSMASVYAVMHRNGSIAALKILHESLSADVAVCERFLGEGYLVNSIKHPGIVRVFDDGMTDDECPFLAMDLLEGQTLEQLRVADGGKIPFRHALEISDQIMDCLSAVHKAGVIHRDLKPQNIFITNEGVAKVLDFGVARLQERSTQHSVVGMVLGTPSFMSPEQALGSRDAVDAKSDVWSLGAIMFTCITGETVHVASTVQARLLAAASVRARSIGTVMPELPPDVILVIDTALQFKKEDRWQSIDAMRTALRNVRGTLRPPGPGEESTSAVKTTIGMAALPADFAKNGHGASKSPHEGQPKNGPLPRGASAIVSVGPPAPVEDPGNSYDDLPTNQYEDPSYDPGRASADSLKPALPALVEPQTTYPWGSVADAPSDDPSPNKRRSRLIVTIAAAVGAAVLAFAIVVALRGPSTPSTTGSPAGSSETIELPNVPPSAIAPTTTATTPPVPTTAPSDDIEILEQSPSAPGQPAPKPRPVRPNPAPKPTAADPAAPAKEPAKDPPKEGNDSLW